MYDIIYRNFSRNVHANDYSELLLTERPELSRGTQLYFESRNCITYQVTEDSIGKMMYLINKMFNLGFEDIVTLADDC
jgi:hypothetical protein